MVSGGLVRVLWEVLWEMLCCVRSSSHTVSGGRFQTHMDSHPLRFDQYVIVRQIRHEEKVNAPLWNLRSLDVMP